MTVENKPITVVVCCADAMCSYTLRCMPQAFTEGFDFQHKHKSSAKACCETNIYTQTDLFLSFKLNVDETFFYPGAYIISVYKTGQEY